MISDFPAYERYYVDPDYLGKDSDFVEAVCSSDHREQIIKSYELVRQAGDKALASAGHSGKMPHLPWKARHSTSSMNPESVVQLYSIFGSYLLDDLKKHSALNTRSYLNARKCWPVIEGDVIRNVVNTARNLSGERQLRGTKVAVRLGAAGSAGVFPLPRNGQVIFVGPSFYSIEAWILWMERAGALDEAGFIGVSALMNICLPDAARFVSGANMPSQARYFDTIRMLTATEIRVDKNVVKHLSFEAQLFSILHEYGHIINGHIGSYRDAIDFNEEIDEETRLSWEYQADHYACNVLLGSGRKHHLVLHSVSMWLLLIYFSNVETDSVASEFALKRLVKICQDHFHNQGVDMFSERIYRTMAGRDTIPTSRSLYERTVGIEEIAQSSYTDAASFLHECIESPPDNLNLPPATRTVRPFSPTLATDLGLWPGAQAWLESYWPKETAAQYRRDNP